MLKKQDRINLFSQPIIFKTIIKRIHKMENSHQGSNNMKTLYRFNLKGPRFQYCLLPQRNIRYQYRKNNKK